MTREELDALVNSTSTSLKGNVFFTHSGAQISLKELKFINSFMAQGDAMIAAKEAGFKPKSDETSKGYQKIAARLLSKPYIYDELVYRVEELERGSVADANEIMSYFTRVMRGEEKDQFNLDAPLGERTAAARELAKRIVDIPNKANEEDRTIKIELDWKRPDE